MSLVRSGAGIIEWSKEELRQIDGKTRKLLTIYRALDPQADIESLYLRRFEGGRGLIDVEECVMLAINSPENYISRTGEIALRVVYQEQILNDIGKDKKALN